MTTETMTAEEILAQAADDIERPGGWCQGETFHDQAACMFGAMYRHAHRHYDALAAACKAVRLEIEADNISAWNDADGRCAEEVAAALRNSKRHLP